MTDFHRRLLQLFILVSSSALLVAAETRTEVVKATTPALDAKPLSPAVPDVYAIEAKFERVVILRFKHQTDLLEGLTRMVKERKIRNAVILSAIGSVRSSPRRCRPAVRSRRTAGSTDSIPRSRVGWAPPVSSA